MITELTKIDVYSMSSKVFEPQAPDLELVLESIITSSRVLSTVRQS